MKCIYEDCDGEYELNVPDVVYSDYSIHCCNKCDSMLQIIPGHSATDNGKWIIFNNNDKKIF